MPDLPSTSEGVKSVSNEIGHDEEDTISVPLPVTQDAQSDPVKTELDMEDIASALESVGRAIVTISTTFERLRILIEGEEGATTHAPPVSAMGPAPCCGRSVLDIPMTERISFDGTGITCKGANIA